MSHILDLVANTVNRYRWLRSHRMFQTRFCTPKTSVAFTDVHITGPDRLHLPISRVFGHLKRREPSQVYTKPVPIAAIFRFRDIGRRQDVTNINFWSPLHNSPFGANTATDSSCTYLTLNKSPAALGKVYFWSRFVLSTTRMSRILGYSENS